MPWPAIPTLIYTDAVSPRAVSWATKDRAGGRVPTPGSWGPAVACSVSAASAAAVQIHSRDGFVVTHVVTCNDRLGNYRDQLRWEETGAILTITAVEPAGDGTGRIWNHYADERPLI